MYSSLRTPAYVLSSQQLEKNLETLDFVQHKASCDVLLALKAFAMYEVFPEIRAVLRGTAASSLYEARLGFEKFGASVHLCAPVYRHGDFSDLLHFSSHVVFNSFSQWLKFRPQVRQSASRVSCGIRINPEHSEVTATIYDPCAPGSRLGVTHADFDFGGLEEIEGLHFHTLCGMNADALQRTLAVVEQKFAPALSKMKWVNFGGGHHITRDDYDVELLIKLIKGFRSRYEVEVFIEPGEAVVLNAGVLVGEVLDILPNGTVILDVSPTCHMPDVLEMPYRPDITGAGTKNQYAHCYRFGGPTCLAGDVVGEYSFAEPLSIGQKIVFEDMSCYTMVKNTMFNGVNLPDICIERPTGEIEVVKSFDYSDYINRLS